MKEILRSYKIKVEIEEDDPIDIKPIIDIEENPIDVKQEIHWKLFFKRH